MSNEKMKKMKIIFVTVALLQFSYVCQCFKTEEHSMLSPEYKQRSFFFLPPIIPLSSFKKRKQITHKDPCVGDCGLSGFCMKKSDCTMNGGTASGLCSDTAVCCINYSRCDSKTQADISYFVNPSYPSAYQNGSRCSVTVTKSDPKICQLRMEFKEFSLMQPSNESTCVDDFFTVNNGFKNKICGDNKGQHIYAHFEEAKDTLTISVDTNAAKQVSRKWNIEIKQIYCNSTLLAPAGCLMYFTSTSGSVSSFNYGELKSTESKRNRQIVGLDYGICIESKNDYCSIEWNQDKDPYSFTVSGNSSLITTANGSMSMTGNICDNNFIIIANPYQNGNPLNVDRFCGSSFSSISTSTEPFVLYSITGQNITENVLNEGNRGFKLNFRQLPCNSN